MANKDPRIDEYIAKSESFAKPILRHLRELVHKACPEVQENMKWSFPHFEHKGILCSMAAFKQHCSFGFWKASLLKDESNLLEKVGDTAMGQFGRITSLKDLPADRTLIAYVKEAADLNERGVTVPKTKQPAKRGEKEIVVPAMVMDPIRKSKKALQTFEKFSYSNKKEYVEWITGAKGEATRERRIAQMVEWLEEGKARNWKYMR